MSTLSSNAPSSTTRVDNSSNLDHMVISYLHEKGLDSVVKKLQKKLKLPVNSLSFLPGGTLAAAVAGTRRNERKRPTRESTKPKSAYDLFVTDRKGKYNMGNTTGKTTHTHTQSDRRPFALFFF